MSPPSKSAHTFSTTSTNESTELLRRDDHANVSKEWKSTELHDGGHFAATRHGSSTRVGAGSFADTSDRVGILPRQRARARSRIHDSVDHEWYPVDVSTNRLSWLENGRGRRVFTGQHREGIKNTAGIFA
jgi:hypothetical protein